MQNTAVCSNYNHLSFSQTLNNLGDSFTEDLFFLLGTKYIDAENAQRIIATISDLNQIGGHSPHGNVATQVAYRLLPAACCLLSAACCLLSAICAVAASACYLLSILLLPLSAACCLLFTLFLFVSSLFSLPSLLPY